MDPLQKLWNLYEETFPKPPLQEPGEPAVGTPQEGDKDNPVIQQKRKVDAMRLSGIPAPEAHEAVHGEVDLSDQQSKADLAKTLGRVQEDGNRKALYIDKNAEHKSLLAKDEELEKKTDTTPDDMKTPLSKEIPDALEPVDTKEEVDYTDDVAFIEKYGRS